MKSLSTSERLIVEPALLSLADFLRGEIELVAELDKLSRSEIDIETIGHIDSAVPFDALMLKPFGSADEVLRECGRAAQADRILRLYENSCDNSEETLRYVESLRIEFQSEDVGNKRPPEKGQHASIQRSQKGKLVSRKVQRVCKLFAEGCTVNKVCKRIEDVSADNARKIKSRYKDYIAVLRKNGNRSLSEQKRLVEEETKLTENTT